MNPETISKVTTKSPITQNNSNHSEIYYEIKLNALMNSDYDGDLTIVRWRKAVIKKIRKLKRYIVFVKRRDTEF